MAFFFLENYGNVCKSEKTKKRGAINAPLLLYVFK